MARIGGTMFLALCFVVLCASLGCDKKTTETQETGIAITFAQCLEFPAKIRIDGNYIGTYPSGHEAVIETAAGSHQLEVDGLGFCVQGTDTTFCWTTNVSVADGQLTPVLLDCTGHGCPCQ